MTNGPAASGNRARAAICARTSSRSAGLASARRSARAFTLIELAAVLVILGIAAALIGTALGGPSRTVTIEDVIEQLEHFDRLTRSHAQRFGEPSTVVFDLDRQRLEWRQAAAQPPAAPGPSLSGDSARLRRAWSLPSGYQLRDVRGAETRAGARRFTLPFTAAGHSPTYALRLTSPHHQSRWLVVAGLSGQVRQIDRETEVQAIFASMQSTAD